MTTSDEQVLHAAGGSDLADLVHEALLEQPGLAVERAPTVERARAALEADGVDCLVASCTLPDGSGREVVEAAREAAPDVGCVLYGESPLADEDVPSEAPLCEFVPSDSGRAVERIVQLATTTASERSQTAYPLPAREPERLAALERYDLESGEALPDLADVAEHAAEHFDVPQATVNVIGADEQRFAVCHGEEWAPIPRQDSICTYTILDEEPTVIADVAADPRFAENDLLDDLGIRSYAGAPVAPAEDAPPIATLCVYADRPDQFDAAEAAYLQTLARDAAAVVARSAEFDTEGSG